MNFLVPEWLLALTLTLFVLDIFLATEVISWGGVLTLAAYITYRIGPTWEWGILVFILAFALSTIVYYGLFRILIGKTFRALLQRGAPDEVIERLKGARGVVHYVEERPMLRWNGDELWPIATDVSLQEGDRVVVVAVQDGILTVEPVK